MDDPFNLNRFVEAQNAVYDRVCKELRSGRKTSHWMWFIFPQIAGLGFSEMARRFAISSIAEARAYLDHPVLGPRLHECTRLVSEIPEKTIHEILSSPDDMKFRSCMTLFWHAARQPDVFDAALKRYFSGQFDALTLEQIQGGGSG
jgi:uncharacterized protein (DUF1810 family)